VEPAEGWHPVKRGTALEIRWPLWVWPLLAIAVAGVWFGFARPRRAFPPPEPARSAGTQQEIWFHTGYSGGAGGSTGGVSALTGPSKMPEVFQAIWREALILPGNLHTDAAWAQGRSPGPVPLDLKSLRAVHSDRYLKALFTGEPRELALSQGLSEWTRDLPKGWLLNAGGLAEAAEAALAKGLITGNLGHGYHHAGVARGMGFCTLNGLAAVATRLVDSGKVRRVMILDLDEHEGNGTAEIVLGDLRIWNVTIHGRSVGGPPAWVNNHVVQVEHGAFPFDGRKRDLNYLAVLASTLPELIQRQNPDFILYQAGMDPFDGSGISPEALWTRDAYVFALARSLGKPLTWVLAGGYADMESLVRLHTGTVRMANRVLERVKAGDRLEHLGTDAFAWSCQGGRIRFADWAGLLGERPRCSRRKSFDEAQARTFVAFRENLRRTQRLPDDELRAAYPR